MTCEILLTRPDMSQVIGAYVQLVDGRITAKATKHGNAQLVRSILKNTNYSDHGRIDRGKNPQAWFKALPATYSGSYIRARMVKDVKAYSPDEARDDRGRWTGGGIDPERIPKSTYPLTTAQRAVETRFRKEIAADPEAMKAAYRGLHGNVLNADLAKELSDDYRNDRTQHAVSVHDPASWLVKEMFKEDLAAPATPGKTNDVFFTAGGAGSGKSTAIAKVGIAAQIANESQIVYDGTLRPAAKAVEKIEQALAAGKNVIIGYIDRPAEDALTKKGVLTRAMQTGRTLPLKEMALQYSSIRDSMKAIQDKYAKNPRVAMFTIQNHGKPEDARLTELNKLPPTKDGDFKELSGRLNHLLDREYRDGRISGKIYQAFKGHGTGPNEEIGI